MQNIVASTDECDEQQWLHVVAAVIVNRDDHILLAKRPSNKHQGGKWEFPGGKVDQGEPANAALARELYEELGIVAHPEQMSRFVDVRHTYTDKSIFLDVWQVTAFSGEPYGREQQEIGWFEKQALAELEFPAANAVILERLLP